MTRAPYELALESQVPADPPVYRFRTADGVHSKRSFRAADRLLLESLWGADLGRLLSLEANYGVVGVVLADSATSVRMVESSARARRLCERNARENGVGATATLAADVTTLESTFDTVTYAPKPYTPLPVAKQRIAHGLAVLCPGGRLYLAASERTGLTRYERCLREMAATVERRAERDEFVLLAATPPREFEPPTHVSPRSLSPEVDGVPLSLVTVPGLFSPTGLDAGTRLLLQTARVADDDSVLDLCCGYGPVGAYAARVADCDVWLSDDDAVATRCAECSLRATGVEGTVVTADCTDGVSNLTFDRILCNPPTHAGDGVLSELFAGARDVLARGGTLTLVHRHELDLRPHLTPFRTVERLRTAEGYVVLRATG